MLGNNALMDVARYAGEFSNQQFVVCVLNNSDLNQVTWEQRVMSGDAKLEASQVLPDFDYAAYARLVGLHGVRVETPEALGAAWDEVLGCGRPAVLDVVCDPEVPPLPPHVTLEQARALAGALRQGDPAARDVIRHGIRGKLAEFLTR
jgi:pyruvate dehydrogenase (quinone)